MFESVLSFFVNKTPSIFVTMFHKRVYKNFYKRVVLKFKNEHSYFYNKNLEILTRNPEVFKKYENKFISYVVNEYYEIYLFRSYGLDTLVFKSSLTKDLSKSSLLKINKTELIDVINYFEFLNSNLTTSSTPVDIYYYRLYNQLVENVITESELKL